MSEVDFNDVKIIRGFILSKLYSLRYWRKPGGRPRGHTSISNIPKGYKPHLSGAVKGEVESLNRMGLVNVFPHKGNGELHVCAVNDPRLIERGLELCNIYRVAVGLPPLDRRFREILDSE